MLLVNARLADISIDGWYMRLPIGTAVLMISIVNSIASHDSWQMWTYNK